MKVMIPSKGSLSMFHVLFFAVTLSLVQMGFGIAPPAMPSLPPVKDPNALIGNELSRLDTLIQATQQSLDAQKKLREKIAEYQKIQDAYLQHSEDNELLFRMIKSAHRTLQSIQENHLVQIFDPDLISELSLLSQIATKRGIPKP